MDSLTGRGSDQIAIRVPDGMRERIKQAARKNMRSMNGEIVAQLQQLFPVDASETEKADARA